SIVLKEGVVAEGVVVAGERGGRAVSRQGQSEQQVGEGHACLGPTLRIGTQGAGESERASGVAVADIVEIGLAQIGAELEIMSASNQGHMVDDLIEVRQLAVGIGYQS